MGDEDEKDPREGVEPTPCPTCACVLNAATSVKELRYPLVERPRPQPGDATVCVGCGALLIFIRSRTKVAVRTIMAVEMDELPQDVRAELLAARDAVIRQIRGRTERN